MNSFESDLKRAVISVPFIAGVIIETIILFTSGFDSDLFKVSVPVGHNLVSVRVSNEGYSEVIPDVFTFIVE